MDSYYWVAIGIVAGGICAYVAYKMWGKWKSFDSGWAALFEAGRETVNALDKFDAMADKYYGEGNLPTHIKEIRDDIERIHKKLGE